jgi:hypothetical protein
VHRNFAQVAVWRDGVLTGAGTFAMTPKGVYEFAAGLGLADEVALEATWQHVGDREAAQVSAA